VFASPFMRSSLYGLFGDAVAGAIAGVPLRSLTNGYLKGTRGYCVSSQTPSSHHSDACFLYCYTPEVDLFWQDTSVVQSDRQRPARRLKRLGAELVLSRRVACHNLRLLEELDTYFAYLGHKHEPEHSQRVRYLQVCTLMPFKADRV
jgi:hypothetical protein